jgi:cytochrome c5
MMHKPEESDAAIGATKSANNAGGPAAEPVERRAGTGRNALQLAIEGVAHRDLYGPICSSHHMHSFNASPCIIKRLL